MKCGIELLEMNSEVKQARTDSPASGRQVTGEIKDIIAAREDKRRKSTADSLSGQTLDIAPEKLPGSDSEGIIGNLWNSWNYVVSLFTVNDEPKNTSNLSIEVEPLKRKLSNLESHSQNEKKQDFNSKERKIKVETERMELAEICNFTNMPGHHSKLSPIPGTRHHELVLISQHERIFKEFQGEVYVKQNLNVIPIAHQEEADKISKKILLDYIKKYSESGVNIENVVSWCSLDLPGFTRTYLYDLENEFNTWKVQALVSKCDHKSHIKESMYRPAYICALHEIMHIEETRVGISKLEHDKFKDIVEVLTVTKTLILMDEVYKRTMGIPLEKEVDYGVSFNLFGKTIPQGRLANFYRNLEGKYKNLAETLVSPESLEFIGTNELQNTVFKGKSFRM